ncbi:MAG: SDR family oxidoreductase [Bacteroidota bacterium]
MSKTIALLGATGQTGRLFLKTALEQGYRVQALVRNPQKLTFSHERLRVIQGDVLQARDVAELVRGTQVVVSLFGHVKGSPEWLQTTGTKNIVAAMKAASVRRIISLSGGGLPFPEKDQPKLVDKAIRFLMKVAVPKVLNDAIEHHRVLAESGLDWTIVRGPRLVNATPKGAYRVGWVGVNTSTVITRGDLADFLLTQVESEEFLAQMPFVSN